MDEQHYLSFFHVMAPHTPARAGTHTYSGTCGIIAEMSICCSN